jgi:hypothetical protein
MSDSPAYQPSDTDQQDWLAHRTGAILEANQAWERLFHKYRLRIIRLFQRFGYRDPDEGAMIVLFAELRRRGTAPEPGKCFWPFIYWHVKGVISHAINGSWHEQQISEGHQERPRGQSHDRQTKRKSVDELLGELKDPWVPMIMDRYKKLTPEEAFHAGLRFLELRSEEIAKLLRISRDAEYARWMRLRNKLE